MNTDTSNAEQQERVRCSALLGANAMNPIFIEYYPHERCECYKVKLPWPRYAEEKIVLCPVTEGVGRATVLAAQVLTKHLADVLGEPLAPNVCVSDARPTTHESK